MRRWPNLFLVGAMKSGTTSLHAWLRTHPQIFMSEPKEPGFFIDPEELELPAHRSLRRYAGREDRYLDLFRSAGPAQRYTGEATVQYTNLPRYTGVAERMARVAGDAHIVYLMRDPVERAISHYLFRVRGGAELRDAERAFREDPRYVDVSRYAWQLQPFIRLFGRERVHTLTTEELAARPAQSLARLFEALGVERQFVPPGLDRRHRVSPRGVVRLTMAAPLRSLFRTRPGRRAREAPDSTFGRLAVWLGGRVETRAGVAAPHIVRELRDRLAGTVHELSALLGRPFDEWTTTLPPGRD